MPIHYLLNDDGGYFVVTYIGKVTDEEMMDACRRRYTSDEWSPTLNALFDLSQADMTAVTSDGIRRVAVFTRRFLEEHEVVSIKTAVYTPEPLSFGLARVYDARIGESPETIQIFEEMHDAESWLRRR